MVVWGRASDSGKLRLAWRVAGLIDRYIRAYAWQHTCMCREGTGSVSRVRQSPNTSRKLSVESVAGE